MDLLSRERTFPLAATGLSFLNALAGGVRNKLTVQAARVAGAPGG